MAGPLSSPAIPQCRARLLDLVDLPVQAAAGPLSAAPLRPGQPGPGLHPHADGGDQRARPTEACADGGLYRSDLEARLPGVALYRLATAEASPRARAPHLRAGRPGHLLLRLGGDVGDR